MFYTNKDTRTKQLVIVKDKIPPMSNDKKKRPDLPLPRNKRKATMSAPGARLVKKPATTPVGLQFRSIRVLHFFPSCLFFDALEFLLPDPRFAVPDLEQAPQRHEWCAVPDTDPKA